MSAEVVGFAAVPNWIVRSQEFSLHQKIVYMVLASHVGRAGSWAMTHGQIAEEAGVGTTTVKKALGELRERGLIDWVEADADNNWVGNTYFLETVDPLVAQRRTPRRQATTPPSRGDYKREEPQEEPTETPPTPSSIDEKAEEFEALWMAWPNQKGKAPARRKWMTLTLKKREKIIPLLLAHANAHRQHTPPQYIPMLSTWLNQERWDDPLPVSRDRGGRNPEPPRAPGIVVPLGHHVVRDEMTGAISVVPD